MSDINKLAEIAKQAGKIILTYYRTDLVTRRKADDSPVTLADQAANDYIVAELAKYFPDIPVVSEEGAKDRKGASRFFLVDPLDGTSGFVRGRGEFTVNIGLVEDFKAHIGVIYIPVTGEMYSGDGSRAYRNGEEIRCRAMPHDGVVLVGSKNHMDAETLSFIEEQKKKFNNLTFIGAASSLKFCRIAEGKADIYPRYGRTMEWDTAAGQAILQSAGGSVVTPDGAPFMYGKNEIFENGAFVARGIS